MTEFAIIGLGSWGLSVLERTISRARRSPTSSIQCHVIQPGAIGGGVYGIHQPDYLVMNNACNQISLCPSPDEIDRPYAVGLYEWAVRRGYRWVGHDCLMNPSGVPIRPTDYLPRRLMGEYLTWFYKALVEDAPPNLEIIHHDASAIDIVADIAGGERIFLDSGVILRVDHVVVTSGHTWNAEAEVGEGMVRYQRPYPVEYFDHVLPPDAPVAIAGMGLVSFDLLTSLTLGRGGSYADSGPRKRYVPSGREPAIYLYSRSGIPYCAKSAHGMDPYGDYDALICTPSAFAALSGANSGRESRNPVDFRRDLLPLIYAEMKVRYHTHAATLRGGPRESSAVRGLLEVAWREDRFESAVSDLEISFGHFNPADHLFAGSSERYESSRDYEAQVYKMVETDLGEALAENGSPVKAAHEVLRILRDRLRSVIEFGGLSLDSYIDFQGNVRSRINRLEAGPPPVRSEQLLALMDAGVVRIPFGPDPEVTAGPGGSVNVRSTNLDRISTATVDRVVRGHLDLPSLARSASPLLKRMYTKGRLTQLTYGDTPVGSVAISEEFHPFDAEGRMQANVSLLGVLTEGARYFTHYLPSPRSRMRAVLDAQACVEAVIG